MIELHSNSAILGTTRTEDGIRPTQHAVHETLEITHGWTPWFETGFYLSTGIQPDEGWEGPDASATCQTARAARRFLDPPNRDDAGPASTGILAL
jgi:hypothetical protein